MPQAAPADPRCSRPGLWRLFASLLAVAVAALLWITWGKGDAAAQPRGQATEAPSPTPCVCSADSGEPNDDLPLAQPLSPLAVQARSFHSLSDMDWFRIEDLQPGRSYSVATFALGGDADTQLTLRDETGFPIKENDDVDATLCRADPQGCASALSWTADGPGPYYVVARTLKYSDCACPSYRISLSQYELFLPLFAMAPPPTITPTPSDTATPQETAATPTGAPPPTPTATRVETGMRFPQAIAVNPYNRVLYVTSRDDDRVYMLNATTLAVIRSAAVPDQPWGVAYYGPRDKVYVASWATGTVTVLDAVTLEVRTSFYVGPNPTWIENAGDMLQLVSYGANALVTIDPVFDGVVRYDTLTRTRGAWALSYNGDLDLTYVSSRDSKTITVVDAAGQQQTIASAGGPTACEPFELDFNPRNDRLYVACDVEGQRDDLLVVHQAAGLGLSPLTEVVVGSGGTDTAWGEDGRGGVVANPATGSIFVSNAADDTVSVFNGATNIVMTTYRAGASPFGLALDLSQHRVFSANRASNDVSAFPDPLK